MNEQNIQLVKSSLQNFFEEELIQEIINTGAVGHIAAGEIVIDINQQITSIPLMLKGSIKVMREDENGKELFLYYIETGNTCAASLTCSLNNSKSTITAIVEEEADLIEIPIELMEKWMGEFPKWRKFILTNYAARYNELLDVVDLLAFKNMNARIFNYLKEKALLHNNKTIDISHQEIAYDLNTSREVVSKILKQMEKNKVVQLKRGEIKINTLTYE